MLLFGSSFSAMATTSATIQATTASGFLGTQASSIWQSVAATSPTSATQGIWGNNLDAAQYYLLAGARRQYYTRRELAELEAQEQQAHQALLAHQQRVAAHRAALAKSRELLLANLTPAQRETFETHQWFVVTGGKTKQQYRIRTANYQGNIDVFEGERIVAKLCCHLGDVPLHDHHLAQKLLLQFDEDDFLRTANRTRVA
jgi:hypothetical protein